MEENGGVGTPPARSTLSRGSDGKGRGPGDGGGLGILPPPVAYVLPEHVPPTLSTAMPSGVGGLGGAGVGGGGLDGGSLLGGGVGVGGGDGGRAPSPVRPSSKGGGGNGGNAEASSVGEGGGGGGAGGDVGDDALIYASLSASKPSTGKSGRKTPAGKKTPSGGAGKKRASKEGAEGRSAGGGKGGGRGSTSTSRGDASAGLDTAGIGDAVMGGLGSLGGGSRGSGRGEEQAARHDAKVAQAVRHAEGRAKGEAVSDSDSDAGGHAGHGFGDGHGRVTRRPAPPPRPAPLPRPAPPPPKEYIYIEPPEDPFGPMGRLRRAKLTKPFELRPRFPPAAPEFVSPLPFWRSHDEELINPDLRASPSLPPLEPFLGEHDGLLPEGCWRAGSLEWRSKPSLLALSPEQRRERMLTKYVHTEPPPLSPPRIRAYSPRAEEVSPVVRLAAAHQYQSGGDNAKRLARLGANAKRFLAESTSLPVLPSLAERYQGIKDVAGWVGGRSGAAGRHSDLQTPVLTEHDMSSSGRPPQAHLGRSWQFDGAASPSGQRGGAGRASPPPQPHAGGSSAHRNAGPPKPAAQLMRNMPSHRSVGRLSHSRANLGRKMLLTYASTGGSLQGTRAVTLAATQSAKRIGHVRLHQDEERSLLESTPWYLRRGLSGSGSGGSALGSAPPPPPPPPGTVEGSVAYALGLQGYGPPLGDGQLLADGSMAWPRELAARGFVPEAGSLPPM